jgi:hypothetical protein
MTIYKFTRLTLPPTLEKQREVLEAYRTLVTEDDEIAWQRRVEIAALRRDLENMRRFVDAMLRQLGELRAEILHEPQAQKYNPDQPRVPAGSPQGGEWTKDGEGGGPNDLNAAPERGGVTSENGRSYAVPVNDSRVISDVTPDNTWKPGAQYAQVEIQNNAKTNNPAIDRTTDILLQTLARIHAVAGDGSGAWYGTRIHLLFANDVRLQNLPGIGWNGVEQSFSLGDIADYGEDGTVRVDVYMTDDAGKVIAIWDVKTGGAVLTGARVRELRAEVGVGSEVPVIELHATRGATLKLRTLGRGGVRISARMW